MTRFRPNAVVTGTLPWAEDRWRLIRIGTAEFRVVKPCRRRRFGQQLIFGQNIIPDGPGVIRAGDRVEILPVVVIVPPPVGRPRAGPVDLGPRPSRRVSRDHGQAVLLGAGLEQARQAGFPGQARQQPGLCPLADLLLLSRWDATENLDLAQPDPPLGRLDQVRGRLPPHPGQIPARPLGRLVMQEVERMREPVFGAACPSCLLAVHPGCFRHRAVRGWRQTWPSQPSRFHSRVIMPVRVVVVTADVCCLRPEQELTQPGLVPQLDRHAAVLLAGLPALPPPGGWAVHARRQAQDPAGHLVTVRRRRLQRGLEGVPDLILLGLTEPPDKIRSQ